MDKAQELVNILNDLEYSITTVESCTGGMISSALIDVPGASGVVNECHVTYSNEAKKKYLSVKEDTLDKYGAVSKEVAFEMASGAITLANADVAIAVTGLAGPGGGTEKKPVGLVYIGCNVKGNIIVREYRFKGTRTEIRSNTTKEAIALAVERLKDKEQIEVRGV